MSLKQPTFKPRMSMITLGVNDMQRAIQFYEAGLGLPRHGEGDDVAFFSLNGTWLGLYPKANLADDIGIEAQGSGFSGFTISHNVDSEEQVDLVMNHVVSVGAKLIKKPEKVFWGGYSGYFQDPDGYYWEVAFNPFTWIGPADEAGN
jgi:uncharacterized glyoxalase superfamily protein PhnB